MSHGAGIREASVGTIWDERTCYFLNPWAGPQVSFMAR